MKRCGLRNLGLPVSATGAERNDDLDVGEMTTYRTVLFKLFSRYGDSFPISSRQTAL
ncbi:MAG: hypothetical protein ACI4MS_07350 [Candidatus Coproplasma sp.]